MGRSQMPHDKLNPETLFRVHYGCSNWRNALQFRKNNWLVTKVALVLFYDFYWGIGVFEDDIHDPIVEVNCGVQLQ